VTQLPLGMAATAPRFPHLKFVTSFDSTFVPSYLANGIAMLQDSVARAPNPAARFQLASYLLFAGRIPEALPQLGRCAQDTPDNPRVWYYLGVAHLKLGQAPLAVTELGRALELAKAGGLADFVPQVEALLQQAHVAAPPAVARPGS
jgi:predicted Zn-dependent protease